MTETGSRLPDPASDGVSHVRVLAHEQVLDAARQAFIAEATLDMQELARRLAVSRATLYRVVSSRERLLGDVLWSLATISLHTAARETRGRLDLERVLEIGSRFRDSALAFEPLSRSRRPSRRRSQRLCSRRAPAAKSWRGRGKTSSGAPSRARGPH